jgi:ADP-heptose:LPS heptosyltransferase
MKNERYLLLRYGGLGDNLFLTPVARELHRQGYSVDVVARTESAAILENNPYIGRLMKARRFGPIRQTGDDRYANLVDVDGLHVPDLALYRQYKTESIRPWRPLNVTNYLNIVEGNTMHPELCSTQQAAFQNIYDNHLAWTGIDPESIPAERKLPVYRVTDEEKQWASNILPDRGRCVMIQTTSSSLAKTYPANDMATWLRGEGYSVLFWQETGHSVGHWILDGVKLALPPHIPSIRCTAALLERCAFAVTADTGTAHLAEALEIRHMTYYTFTPAWTLSKYYINEWTVDSTAELDGVRCKCYQLSRDCPRIQVGAFKRLSKTDRELLLTFPDDPAQRQQMGLPPAENVLPPKTDLYAYFRCNSVDALSARCDTAFRNLEALRSQRPYCTDSLNLMGELKKGLEWLCGGER